MQESKQEVTNIDFLVKYGEVPFETVRVQCTSLGGVFN